MSFIIEGSDDSVLSFTKNEEGLSLICDTGHYECSTPIICEFKINEEQRLELIKILKC